jgi:molecular chaperone GrpE
MGTDMTEESKDPEGAEPQDPTAAGFAPADSADVNEGTEGRDQQTSLEALREQAEENWNKYLRAVAETENLRRRSVRDVDNARKFGAERLAAGLLPVRDSLEAGLKLAEDADAASIDVSSLLDGERATLRLLEQAFEAAGIYQIDPVGETFDPAKHEAISMQPSAQVEPGSILNVIQKGYELNDRVVRPARVIVAQQPPAEPDVAGNPPPSD